MSRHGLDDFLEDPKAFDDATLFKNYFGFRNLLYYAGYHRYQSFSFDKRLQHFWRIVSSGDQSSSEELRFMLPETKNLTIGILECSRMAGRPSIFRSLALGMMLQNVGRLGGSERKPRSEIEWYGLLKTTLELDPVGLHHLEKRNQCCDTKYRTAFALLISRIPYWHTRCHRRTRKEEGWHYSQLYSGIDAWLDTLARNQVDLLSYGRKERALYKEGLSHIQHSWFISGSHMSRPIHLHLIGITFGPARENWRLWWADGHEEYAGDFWAMV